LKSIVFHNQKDSNIWEYEKLRIYEVKDYRWILEINNEPYIYDSIYDIVDELVVRGFNATFRIPKEMEDVNPMDKCE